MSNKQMDNENVVHLDNVIFLSVKTKEREMKLAHKWMELRKIIPSELSQTQKEMCSLISGS